MCVTDQFPHTVVLVTCPHLPFALQQLQKYVFFLAVPRSLVHVFSPEVRCFTWAFAFVGLKLHFRQLALNCFIVVVLFVLFMINTPSI